MPDTRTTAAHWRERATEARSVADVLHDPEAKQTMIQIAESYERLARLARDRPDQSK